MLGNTTSTVFTLAATALYFAGGAMVWRHMFISPQAAAGFLSVVILAIMATVIQGILLYVAVIASASISMTLPQAASMASWIAVILFVLLACYKKSANLGLLILPLAALCMLFTFFWPAPAKPIAAQSPMAVLHVLVALLAYGFLALAVAQALLLQYQENRLRQRHRHQKMTVMPAVESMEHTMFALILSGFVLLTVTLVSGAVFSEQFYGRALVFNHHIVLSLCAWLSFGVLLAGRYLRGWRGQRATLWTCAGFGILVLAYFGTRLVLEVILERGG